MVLKNAMMWTFSVPIDYVIAGENGESWANKYQESPMTTKKKKKKNHNNKKEEKIYIYIYVYIEGVEVLCCNFYFQVGYI